MNGFGKNKVEIIGSRVALISKMLPFSKKCSSFLVRSSLVPHNFGSAFSSLRFFSGNQRDGEVRYIFECMYVYIYIYVYVNIYI
jgi:hypothetical protein